MATSKKNRLVQRAAQTVRRPSAERLLDKGKQKVGYRVVPTSLYTPEADWVDEIAGKLKRTGYTKANRSMVIQEAVKLLREQIGEKGPEELLQFFIKRHRQAALL